MPTPTSYPIIDEQDFFTEVLAAKAKGTPVKEKTVGNIHIILDKDNPEDVKLGEILDSVQAAIQKEHPGNRKGLWKYIGKVLLVRWSKS